jgi:AraC-like DNA-binding protein
LLTSPNRPDRTISAIAFDASFGDLSHFNRLFRRRFGATPSEVRAETLRSSRRTELGANGSALGKSGGEG